MTTNDAIEAIDCNYPDERYSELRAALELSKSAMTLLDVIEKYCMEAAQNSFKRDEQDDANTFYDICDVIKEWQGDKAYYD